ncbi:PP2C family protein-serine/threonine phosphatase [Neorhodopirellula pilleata]|uniref:Serine/threonine phosphatase stp n=1 Tax=Neorhodopirellula pilleata TaxID=2714738 RepID=A0A5C6APK3_9BACT|nr:protein phosphatase 2C domain-containing protein [Neorhodopirellula pilleata]TWU01620.1 Serine/threonine phosphatase stp [Neorhodopirellula pilleata]
MTTVLDTAVHLFLESEMESPRVLPVDFVDSHRFGAGKPGHLVVFSRTCPDKDEPNDDSAAVIRLPDGALVMAVADGVGGAPLGYKASAIAVQCIAESLQDRIDGSDLRPAILDGIERANAEILDMGTGAATTISIVEVQNRIARGYQVGDSMAMIVGQRGTMKWRSTSHSPVGYLIESGAIEEAEAMLHDDRHIVSNLVGSREMHIEIGPAIPLAVRDSIVIASDGLFDNLQLGEIAQLARIGKPLDRMNALVALASKRMRGEDHSMPGKPDDLAVVLMTP